MTLDKFTIKAQEAVQQAVNTAQLNGQQVYSKEYWRRRRTSVPSSSRNSV